MPTIRAEIPKNAIVEVVNKDLDMADKLLEAATVRIASYQKRLTNLYSRHVKPRAFTARDLVLRRVFENTADITARKFQQN